MAEGTTCGKIIFFKTKISMEKLQFFNSLIETDIFAEIGETDSITQLLAQAPQYLERKEPKRFTSVFIKRMSKWTRLKKDVNWKIEDKFRYFSSVSCITMDESSN